MLTCDCTLRGDAHRVFGRQVKTIARRTDRVAARHANILPFAVPENLHAHSMSFRLLSRLASNHTTDIKRSRHEKVAP